MKNISRVILLGSALLLAACASEENEDIKAWMSNASKDLKGKVPPSIELKPFPPVPYGAGNQVDPFNSAKLTPEPMGSAGENAPDPNRSKDPLEAYPLESLSMVGSILPGKATVKTAHALIKSRDGLFDVVVGNHLGQNSGVVTVITENEVKIKETLKDPTGQTPNWITREVRLFLEGAKK